MTEEREKAVKCLRELRNLLTDDEDLRLPIHDEKFLIRFVRGKKYNSVSARECVRKYYTLRKKNPKIFKIIHPSNEQVGYVLKTNAVMKLKHNASDGRAIIVWNITKWNLEKFNLDHMIAGLALVIEELLLFSEETQINGAILLSNDGGLNFSLMKEFTPGRMRSLLQVLKGSFPLRLKQILVVNEPPIIEKLMALLRPFMSDKIRERIQFFGKEFDKLHAILPAEYLPQECGGKLTDDEAYDNTFRDKIFQKDGYYKELLEYGYGNWDSDEEDTYM